MMDKRKAAFHVFDLVVYIILDEARKKCSAGMAPEQAVDEVCNHFRHVALGLVAKGALKDSPHVVASFMPFTPEQPDA